MGPTETIPPDRPSQLLLGRIQSLPASDAAWRAVAEEAAGIVSNGNRPQPALLAICGLVFALAEHGDRRTGRDVAAKALAHAERSHETTTEIVALRALGECARHEGRLYEAIRYFRKRREIAGGQADSIADEIYPLQLSDDFEASKSLLFEAKRSAEAAGVRWARLPTLAVAEMRHNYLIGSFDEAEANARAIFHEADVEQVEHPFEARVILGRIAQVRGDFPSARRLLNAAGSCAIRNEDWWTLLSLSQASLAQSEGDDMGAVRRFRSAARAAAGAATLRSWTPNWLVDGMRAALRSGDRGLAKEIVSFGKTIAARSPGAVSVNGTASQTEAMLESNVEALGKAVDTLRTSPRLCVRAEAALDYGRALLAEGQHVAGIAALDNAWDFFSRTGAQGKAAGVRQLLLDAGIRRRRWTSAPKPLQGWGALTPAEQRVARLLAEGHTNRSAATQLNATRNTVSSHARSIFGKLGIRSRVELTRVVLSES